MQHQYAVEISSKGQVFDSLVVTATDATEAAHAFMEKRYGHRAFLQAINYDGTSLRTVDEQADTYEATGNVYKPVGKGGFQATEVSGGVVTITASRA